MRLSKVKLKTLDVDSVDMHFQSFYANLYHGTINIDPSNNSICENIALIFTISVLHVLCAPENPGRRMKLSFGKLYHIQRQDKTCLQGFPQSQTKTSLLSYKD